MDTAAAPRLVRENLAHDPPEPRLSGDELAALGHRLHLVPRFFRYYGWWKVRLDPVYAFVLAQIGEAKVVLDLGAGMGLMEALFAARSPAGRIRGVEWDVRKVAVAQRLLRGMSTATAEHGDAREVPQGSPDAVLLIDLLHYMDPSVQRAMLERLGRALACDGILIVRELDRRNDGRNFAELIERAAVRWGWNRGAGVNALSVEEIVSLLRNLGLSVEVLKGGRGVFSANVLIVARKAGAASNGPIERSF